MMARTRLVSLILSLLFVLTALPGTGLAQQQFQGVCAGVKIVIQQELTLERIGFEATLEITNNDGEDPITDFFAALTFENPALSTNGVANDSSSLFFVRQPTFQNVNSVSGDGVISPTTKAVVKWFIIPKITAGGTSPEGIRYRVGCQLAGKIRGATIPAEVMVAIPAPIYVRPEPQLEITYFQPRDVQGDDPFTPQVESPIPFTVGVLVKNSGYGLAKKVQIASQQPKIVENKQNLLLIAQLLGSRVADVPMPATLTVNLGDIPPGQTRKGAWDMITSLSGEFVEFKASYTHASDLGGLETSVIKSLNAYFISKEVMNDQPGRDNLRDFLAITDNNENLVPNALYESQGNVLPVNFQTNAAVVGTAGAGGSFQVTLTSDKPGWNYLRLMDPGQARLPIANVVRSDGKVLNPNNYWTNVRYTRTGNVRQAFLNIFDLVEIQSYTYTVTYAQVVADVTAPVTSIHFAGSVSESGNKFYITPDTQVYFTSEDDSPVSMFYSVTNGPFLPALPFSLPAAGDYVVRYYSVDSFGNHETTNATVLVVSGSAALGFAEISAPSDPIFSTGDALSLRPATAPILFQAAANPSRVDAQLDILQGVVGWVTVSNVPSSPTASTSAALRVGGDYVDFYKYKLNNNTWSPEQPVSQPISLQNLTAGQQTISVLGRSRHGYYLDTTNAVSVSWIISASAPPTTVAGTPATPTRDRSAQLTISGTGVSAYKWTVNDSYYRPETNAPGQLAFNVTSATQQVVTISVLGKTNGGYQANPTKVTWSFDPLFGHAQTGLPLTRSVVLTNIGSALQTFSWDGRDANGAPAQPGAYTIRITLRDSLGRTNFVTRLVRIGELSGDQAIIADILRGPKNPYARRNWAVWQDQSSGNFEIYAQNLQTASPINKLTSTPLSQENPRTDGRYLVWQARRENGNWDIMLKDLNSPALPQAITSSPTVDEVNPAIDWPWLVYQRRPSANPNAPWQVAVLNLTSGQPIVTSPSGGDQLNPDIQAGRVVWQDWRDPGPGEIYLKNLETGEQTRLTTNSFGQYHPAIFGNWIVWQDNRNSQVDLYSYDLSRKREFRLTTTPENESRPYLDGPWAICLEDSMGSQTANLKLLHLPTRISLPITRTPALKERPTLAGGNALWLEITNSLGRVMSAQIPALQSVFETANAVPVTATMAQYQQTAHALLRLWNAQAGVTELTTYTSLVPQISSQTVTWVNGAPAGPDFTLTPGSFLWVRFASKAVVDLGPAPAPPITLAAGANVLSYTGFPSQYSAYALLRQLGADNARAVRMLDSSTGEWVVAEYYSGRPIGVDFTIPRVAVVMLDLLKPINNFQPH